uniref:Uncharacterized protein n=1 Tax=Octopus bimaculoides TaxID=37653 RepID=A0A0L8H1V6_OCTBM
MRRLTRNQKERAIGCLYFCQRPWGIANDMTCSIRIIECLRERYNATNCTDDHLRSDRPRVTTARQSHHLFTALPGPIPEGNGIS